MNIYGIPKPAYRAYELLHRLGNELLQVKGKHETVDVWIVRNSNKLNIIITNWALPLHPIKTETVKINMENTGEIKAAFIERIDDEHCNPKRAWKKMGSRESLTHNEVSALEKASSLIMEPLNLLQKKQSAIIQVIVPPQGIAFLTLEIE